MPSASLLSIFEENIFDPTTWLMERYRSMVYSIVERSNLRDAIHTEDATLAMLDVFVEPSVDPRVSFAINVLPQACQDVIKELSRDLNVCSSVVLNSLVALSSQIRGSECRIVWV